MRGVEDVGGEDEVGFGTFIVIVIVNIVVVFVGTIVMVIIGVSGGVAAVHIIGVRIRPIERGGCDAAVAAAVATGSRSEGKEGGVLRNVVLEIGDDGWEVGEGGVCGCLGVIYVRGVEEGRGSYANQAGAGAKLEDVDGGRRGRIFGSGG